MTKPERTYRRPTQFSDWVRSNCPKGETGFKVTDVDFFMYNYVTRKAMILEEKHKNKELEPWQRHMFSHLNNWIRSGMYKGWDYLGFHVLTFENTFFNNGQVYFDDKLKSEEEIKRILSF